MTGVQTCALPISYTSTRITKVPLDIDATLISDGTGTALDSASLSGDHLVVNQNVPLVSQQQISVESPANADVVTLQVGSSVRRTDKQKDSGLVLAIVDTVTLNRRTAMAVSDDTHTGGSVQKPRTFGDENPPDGPILAVSVEDLGEKEAVLAAQPEAFFTKIGRAHV